MGTKSGLYPNEQIIEVFGEQVKWPGLGPDGKFTNGSFTDPLIKPSFIPAETLNLLLDNMQMVIEAAGLDPNNIEPDQLLRALQELAGSGWAGGDGEKVIIPPHAGVARNLALVVLGHEVTGPADVTAVVDAISATVRAGMIDNLYIAPGDADYFGLASISIQAGSDSGGAYSATLANIPSGSYGRNLDFVLVAKNPYLDKNGNTQPHVFVQSRHVLSAMTAANTGGHYMNPTITNAGGYLASKGRQFVINQVKNALLVAGIPVNDPMKILPLSRRVANGGSQATGTDAITDNVTLITEYETNGIVISIYEPASGQSHFEFYGDYKALEKRNAAGQIVVWWCASAVAANIGGFYPIAYEGANFTNNANAEYGIAPAYAIG
jgi:hypothetical protein